MTPSVGLVVPAYSPDVAQLTEYVEQLDEVLSPATIRIELDAADADVTSQLAELPATVNSVPYRRGKGAAITDGFEAVSTDVLSFADADGATPAREMKTVIQAVTEGDADLAAGSRRHPDATVATHQTRARRYLGDSFAWLARRLLEVHLYDYQCGAKAMTSEAWKQVRHHIYESGFAWDVELLAIAGALNLEVEEVPVEWYDRPGSTVSPIRTSLDLAQALVASRHRAKQLSNSRLHTAIADRREEPNALIEQE